MRPRAKGDPDPTTSLYLIGESGVGKSTVMRELVSRHRVAPAVRLRGSLRGEPFVTLDGSTGVQLGRSGGRGSGTDALPRQVTADAVAWAHLTRVLPRWVYGEGDRLAHVRFLLALAHRGPLLVAYLTAPAGVCRDRREARDLGHRPVQESTARAVASKARRLADLFVAAPGATVITVDTYRMTAENAADAVRTCLGVL